MIIEKQRAKNKLPMKTSCLFVQEVVDTYYTPSVRKSPVLLLFAREKKEMSEMKKSIHLDRERDRH